MFYVVVTVVLALDFQVKLGYLDGKCQLQGKSASALIIFPLKNKATCENVGTPLNVKTCDASMLVQTCERDIDVNSYKDHYLSSQLVARATKCEYKLAQQNEYLTKVKGATVYFSLNNQFKMNGLDKNNPFHHVVTTCSFGKLLQYFCDQKDLRKAMCFPSTKILTPENLFCYDSDPCIGKEWIPSQLINAAGDQMNL